MSWTFTLVASGSKAELPGEIIAIRAAAEARDTGHDVESATFNGQPLKNGISPDISVRFIRRPITEAVARGWCHPKNAEKAMDPDLAEAIVDELCAWFGGPGGGAKNAGGSNLIAFGDGKP